MVRYDEAPSSIVVTSSHRDANLNDTESETRVMGMRARAGVKGLILGNTAEMIIHHCTSNVVVLR
ncbi:MAG: hypothetical protein CMQ21_13690 [Gammaproteobacteria bacterium]|nr:hypothetical protein [Gammaproteobacteria bacterium]